MTQEQEQRLKVSVPLLLQLATIIISVVLAYGQLDKRITALEVKYERIAADIVEIKADLKQLLRLAGGRP